MSCTMISGCPTSATAAAKASYGFYLVRSFEKYTVPVTFGIMALMSILARTRPGVVNWGLASHLHGAAHFSALTGLVTAIGVGWAISWVTWASDYSRFVPSSISSKKVYWYSYAGLFVPSSISSKKVYWYSYAGLFVPTVWLAILGATIASVSQS